MSNTAVDLKIYNNGVAEVTTFSNGVKRSKVAQLSDLANLLSAYSSGFTPLLPEGTIKHGFKNGRTKVLIAYDEVFYEQKYNTYGSSYTNRIEYCDFDDNEVSLEYNCYDDDDDREYEFTVNAYLPKTLFLVDLVLDGDKYYINSHGCRMWHYFDDILTNDTKLFAFPFGNVFDNNELCFGGMEILNSRYNKDDLRGLKSIFHNWQCATSNLDLTYKLNNGNSFDYIYDYSKKLRPVKSLEELKSKPELYTEVRTMLEEGVKDLGITFSSFLSDTMR